MNLHSRSIITAATAFLALAAASACADGVHGQRAAKQASVSSNAAAMTVAARKPNDSGVAIQYRVEGTPRVGQAVTIVLQFDGVSDPAGATVRLTTDAGLYLATNNSLTLPAGQSTTTTAKVTADRDGLAYLNVFVSQGGATSIVAIPIQTGASAPAMKSAGEMNSSAEGEKIISMPAKEPKASR
ncbi:hypothetical protein [uncultured Variovorax sp.]|uniref:hypothetical protein n=1 Tax=uncultured Variovorax sp. TaxID=114708 RepID=UPI0025DD1653|nr:hypothetical protein [uncultured Variovorax sp.]